jgi:hypothetical protein
LAWLVSANPSPFEIRRQQRPAYRAIALSICRHCDTQRLDPAGHATGDVTQGPPPRRQRRPIIIGQSVRGFPSHRSTKPSCTLILELDNLGPG